MFQDKLMFEGLFSLSSSADHNGLYNFSRGRYEKHFCEIIWARGSEMSGGHL